jgi:hypothetical protein
LRGAPYALNVYNIASLCPRRRWREDAFARADWLMRRLQVTLREMAPVPRPRRPTEGLHY